MEDYVKHGARPSCHVWAMMRERMQGKTVVITGATSGIGEVTATRLAALGARIVFVARDKNRGDATLARLRQAGSEVDHRVCYADLSRLSEMKRVAQEIAASEPRIDILMNNAGAIFDKRYETEDGLERTFALNHMSYFVITQILRERLAATPGARIVSTSSHAHRRAAVDFSDLQLAKGYGSLDAYCKSKLYNILFTRELSRRIKDTGVLANCFHPGFVATRFADEGKGITASAFRLAKRLALRPEEGARTMIFLASSANVDKVTGEYFEKCALSTTTPAAHDDAAAKRLWAESARIAGIPE
jgi:NAD(P)-dependent dehydrogenase (short-subunit alcohol dehydrogenase family)